MKSAGRIISFPWDLGGGACGETGNFGGNFPRFPAGPENVVLGLSVLWVAIDRPVGLNLACFVFFQTEVWAVHYNMVGPRGDVLY